MYERRSMTSVEFGWNLFLYKVLFDILFLIKLSTLICSRQGVVFVKNLNDERIEPQKCMELHIFDTQTKYIDYNPV